MLKELSTVDILKSMSLLFLGLAVGTSIGKFTAVAAILAIIACFMDKERFANIKNGIFTKSFMAFCAYVGVVLVVSLIQGNSRGSHMILRDFEKIATFLVIYLFIGKVKKFFNIAVIGIMIGSLCNDVVVIQKVLTSPIVLKLRYGGLFGHPNSLGSITELMVPVFVYSAYRFRNNKTILFLSVISVVGALISGYVAGSRGGAMAVAVELVAFAVLYFYRKNQGVALWKYVLALAFLGIIVVGGTAKFYARSYDMERVLLWTSAWQMFLDHPFLGVGFHQWGDTYRATYINPLAKEPNLPHPHNLYLFVLSECGVVGIVAYLNMLLYQLKTSMKYSKLYSRLQGEYWNVADMFIIAMCGLAVHNLVDVNAIMRYYMLMFFLLWGLCCLWFREVDELAKMKQ